MDALNAYFDELVKTPAGALLVFLLVFLARVTVAELRDLPIRRRKPHARKPQT